MCLRSLSDGLIITKTSEGNISQTYFVAFVLFTYRVTSTNYLVKDNEGCLRHLNDNLSVTPRKSLETPVTVVSQGREEKDEILCYFPREDTRDTLLGNESPRFCNNLLSC